MLAPKRIPLASPFVVLQAKADDSLCVGPKQLPLSDVIEEVITYFPQGGHIQHTTSLTLTVSQYQSHLLIGAVWAYIYI